MNEASDGDLTAFFTRDHRGIDLLLESFRAAARPQEALAAFEAFDRALRRHIGWEEDWLFPAFEAVLGNEARPVTSSMKIQHDELKEQLAQLRAAIPLGGDARRNAEAVVLESLADHNHAEEDYIYPWIDGALPPTQRKALLASLAR